MAIYGPARRRRTTFGGLTAAPLVGGLVRRLAALRNDLPARAVTTLEEGIAVGGVPSGAAWKKLRDWGVDAAVCLIGEAPPLGHPGLERTLWLPTPDHRAPTLHQLAAGCSFIAAECERGGRILLYCLSGQGRAPTLYLAWRLWSDPMRALDAEIVRLTALRASVAITASQRERLRDWGSAIKSFPHARTRRSRGE